MKNKTCHNYCEPQSSIPAGVKQFLGLGLKFCIKTPRPTNKLNKTFERFKNDIRRIHYFKTHPSEEENEGEVTYIPELYIKSDWEPPECADKNIEKSMADFETTLRREQQLYNKPTLSNLTPKDSEEWLQLNSNSLIMVYLVLNIEEDYVSRERLISITVSSTEAKK